jgi:hypothetical protein
MFLDLMFPDIEAVPAYISHRLAVSQADANGQERTYVATDAPVAVDRRDPIVLSPPLRGPRWLDGDSCCKQIGGHRWALTPINGRAEPVETFAADLIQLRKDGRAYSGAALIVSRVLAHLSHRSFDRSALTAMYLPKPLSRRLG